MVKNLLAVPLVLLLTAQKPVKKPDVHPDFQFGSYPWSRTAETMLQDDLAREVIVAYSKGWSIDKIAKTLKISSNDVSKVSDKLEDERLVGRRDDDLDPSPFIVVLRERDWDRMKEPLGRHTLEVTKVLTDHWTEIQAMADSLDGGKNIPKGRLMYETVVSGILLGGMMDAFYEDQTLMAPPPRRGKTDRYFGWLVESNAEAAGKLRRELRESAGYRIVTIGSALSESRLNPDDLKGKDTVLEDADARKYRLFISTFTRDTLLPFFKSRRPEFLKTAAMLSSGGDVSFSQFFAWYYNTISNGVTDALIRQGRITPPEKLYTYAVKAP